MKTQEITFTDIFGQDKNSVKQLEQMLSAVQINNQSKDFEYIYSADDEQKKFINSSCETIRLLAPAGSGKTQTIINRVLKKISTGDTPDSYLILTFDNAAKISLEEKYNEGLQNINSKVTLKPSITTLNSFGNRIIRDYLKDIYRNYSVALDSDCYAAIKVTLDELKAKAPNIYKLFPRYIKRKVYLDVISNFKNFIIDPDNIDTNLCIELFRETKMLTPWFDYAASVTNNEQYKTQIPSAFVFIYQKYCEILKNNAKIDFDDQKLISYLHLIKDRKLTSMVVSQYKEVIVDEFQDINKLDFELIRLLSENRILIVVGDDDQAIYTFRGCSPKYIINFDKLSNRTIENIVLSINYRCPKNIVELSKNLISNNQFRIQKESIPDRQDLADVVVWNAINSGGEAQIIARMIKRIYDTKNTSGFKYGDVAVLYRVNSQSLPLQIALLLEDIPYYCRKEDNIIISEIMKKLLMLIELHLKLLQDQNYFDIKHTRNLVECFHRYSNERDITELNNFIAQSGGYKNFTQKYFNFNNRLINRDFVISIAGLFLSYPNPEKLVGFLTTSFKNMSGVIGTLEDALNNALPLGEFVDIASRFRGSIKEFYTLLIGLQNKVQAGLYKNKEEPDAVSLITYFRAKGRQWNTIFLPGSNNGVIPDFRSLIEDERRLFYVAITRATSNLFISYVRKHVGVNINISQFILEMGLSEGEQKRATDIN